MERCPATWNPTPGKTSFLQKGASGGSHGNVGVPCFLGQVTGGCCNLLSPAIQSGQIGQNEMNLILLVQSKSTFHHLWFQFGSICGQGPKVLFLIANSVSVLSPHSN